MFGFDLSGLNIMGASGGIAEESGFQIDLYLNTIIGLSMIDTTIPPSNTVLVNIGFENLEEVVCLENVILYGEGGIVFDVEVGDCFSLLRGCMDRKALNYDSNARINQGCEY